MKCSNCGTDLPDGASFCGACGTPQALVGAGEAPIPATPPPPPGAPGVEAIPATPPPPPGAPGVAPTGADWTGVSPVIEPTQAMPPVGPPEPPYVPPVPGPVPPGDGGGGKKTGLIIAIAAVVVAILGVGGFLLFGGGDDEVAGDDTTTTEDPDDTTTTTEEEPDDTTTTTEETTTSTTAPPQTTATTAPPGSGTVLLEDDSGRLIVTVPDDWVGDGRPLTNGLANLQASDDLAAFQGSAAVSGLSYSQLQGSPSPDSVIDLLANGNNLNNACTPQARQDYTDGVFTGRIQEFTECNGNGTRFIELAAFVTTDPTITIELTVILVPPDGNDILQLILNTFNIRQ